MEGKASDWRPGPTVCRCCLNEGCYKDISTEYFWMGKREVYAEMLSETLNVSIAYSQSGGPNSNSRLICEQCIGRLRDASEFKRQVIDCEKTFMHHLDPGSSSKSREFNVDSMGDVKVEVVKREKELSDDDFDDRPDFLDVDTDDDLDDQPLTKLASKIPKKESVDLLELLDSSQITVKRKSTLKVKEPPKKIVKKKEIAIKPSASKAPPAKQAEKKKDDEWTTTDMRNRIPIDIKRTSEMNMRIISQVDEWITTDITDVVQIDTQYRTEEKPQSYLKQPYVVEDEWVTTDFVENSQPYIKQNVPEDYEWVVSDMTKQILEKNKTKSSSDVNTKTQSCMKQGMPEWTTTFIRKSPDVAPECAPVGLRESGQQQQRLKIVAADRIRRPSIMKSQIIRKINHSVKVAKKYLTRPRNRLKQPPSKHFLNARLILNHTTAIPIKIELNSSDIPCFACPRKFADPFLFREHFLAEHKTADRTRGMNIFNNVQTRADITDLSCLVCTQVFDSLEDAALHLVQEHKIDIDLKERLGLVPIKLLQKSYICVVCQKKCVSFRDLYRHSGSHFYFYICEICGVQFESFQGLNDHIKRKHGEAHRCYYCKDVFPTALELKQHVRSNYRCSPFKCKICRKPFILANLLRIHRETVHGAPKRTYKCLECLKVFEKAMPLYLHFKKHHTDDYKCDHCGKTFSTSKLLKLHLLVHTDERPFQCDLCQQTFKYPSYVRKHITKCKMVNV